MPSRKRADLEPVSLEVNDFVSEVAWPLLHDNAEGLGMGLAIARILVEAHSGWLSAANNGDGGATFHFTLPVAPEDVR